ncbi:MAG: hypothetical protein M3154_04735, partial [Candidatus Eremiobacteraeota bacterium]|nr:hypothetical protein [Candidatus Eremiobacteraeota bacterium]
QAEADVAAERAREDARRKAEADAAAAASSTSVNGVGQPSIVPDPLTGAPGPTTIARPHD